MITDDCNSEVTSSSTFEAHVRFATALSLELCHNDLGFLERGAHQGLALLEGAAQHLEEAEEHSRVDPIAQCARANSPVHVNNQSLLSSRKQFVRVQQA